MKSREPNLQVAIEHFNALCPIGTEGALRFGASGFNVRTKVLSQGRISFDRIVASFEGVAGGYPVSLFLDDAPGIRSCVICRCNDHDCSQCVEKTGQACFWVGPRLCSACAL